jgi:S-adenosylmethionine hydrolase
MAKRQLMTLTTDFGHRDPYVAAMKGAVLSAYPQAQIIDVTHDIPPYDVLAAALVIGQVAPWFPPETLHVVVVDPGVGTSRHVLAGRFGGQLLLFPDNGVITSVAAKLPLEELAAVSVAQLIGQPASATFHGRDVFAPLAAMLLKGMEVPKLGPVPGTYKLLDLPEPRVEGAAVVGQVIYVDHFGNLVSNISREFLLAQLGRFDGLTVSIAGRRVGPLEGSYDFVPQGQPLALIDSMGCVEIAVNHGRAATVLGAAFGAEVRVEPA